MGITLDQLGKAISHTKKYVDNNMIKSVDVTLTDEETPKSEIVDGVIKLKIPYTERYYLQSPVADCSTGNGACYLKWIDPDDLKYAHWAGTRIVRKIGSPPMDENDGDLVLDTKDRNVYADKYYKDAGLVNDVEYHYGIFPYTTDGKYTYDCRIKLTPRFVACTFADGTWEQIKDMLDAHYNGDINIENYWSVGDTRKITLTESEAYGCVQKQPQQTRTLVIIGFNHDKLEQPIGVRQYAAVTLHFKEVLHNNAHPTSVDPESVGYKGSMKEYELSIWEHTKFVKMLPTVLEQMIKPVYKTDYDFNKPWTIYDNVFKVFDLSLAEFGLGASYDHYTYKYAKGGTVYEYYKISNNRYLTFETWFQVESKGIYLRGNMTQNGSITGFPLWNTVAGRGIGCWWIEAHWDRPHKESDNFVAPAFCL